MLDLPGIRAVDRALSLSFIWGASSSPPHLGLRSLYGCITSERYHRAIRGKMTPNQMNAAIPERRPATEEISGLIERVTFHNDESGFCVLRVKARGQREETTVVGSLPSVTAGEWLSAEGWWVRDREHGLQFKATTMKTVPPPTAEAILWLDRLPM